MHGPYVIIGIPQSLFVRQLASHWRSTGAKVFVVKLRGEDESLPDGTPVLSGEASAREAGTRRRIVGRALHELWRLQTFIAPQRHDPARNGGLVYPSFVEPLVWGGPAARRAQSLKPAFVFGQEAFAHGVATALCRYTPRILMPWGADVFWAPNGSPVSFAMVRWVLRSVDLVCPTSIAATSYIERRFGVPSTRLRAVSWGLDRDLFRARDMRDRIATRRSLGLDPSLPMILSVRRFLPGWGGAATVEGLLRLCEDDPRPLSFVLLGGAGSEPYVRIARERIAGTRFAERFRFIDADLSLAECARLMAAADVFVSLMGAGDMRSASVLQAASSGAVPVLAEHPEYRAIERLGFRALFVDPADPAQVAVAIRSYLDSAELCEETRDSNRRYLATYEDSRVQMRQLLEVIESACRSASKRSR